MKVNLTVQERVQLQNLLDIVKNEELSIGERAIAKIKFQQIYAKAKRREEKGIKYGAR